MIDAVAIIQEFIEFIDKACELDDERGEEIRQMLVEWKMEIEHEECE